MEPETTQAALWWAVIGSGIYHGINPGMGWPLAVSAALMERRWRALPRALAALALGHLIAMLAILLPFAALAVLAFWHTEIRIGAALLLIGLGLYLLINTRHPRFLSRVPPARLALWSCLVALVHGAGLMLVPLYLGLCAIEDLDAGHRAASALMGSNITTALGVALAHTLAMTATGGAIAAGVYHWIGLRFVRQSWFNLDRIWAASLVLVGIIGLVTAL